MALINIALVPSTTEHLFMHSLATQTPRLVCACPSAMLIAIVFSVVSLESFL